MKPCFLILLLLEWVPLKEQGAEEQGAKEEEEEGV